MRIQLLLAGCSVLLRRCLACVQGSIPFVPYLRAPFYVWVGRVRPLARVVAEPKVSAGSRLQHAILPGICPCDWPLGLVASAPAAWHVSAAGCINSPGLL